MHESSPWQYVRRTSSSAGPNPWAFLRSGVPFCDRYQVMYIDRSECNHGIATHLHRTCSTAQHPRWIHLHIAAPSTITERSTMLAKVAPVPRAGEAHAAQLRDWGIAQNVTVTN